MEDSRAERALELLVQLSFLLKLNRKKETKGHRVAVTCPRSHI